MNSEILFWAIWLVIGIPVLWMMYPRRHSSELPSPEVRTKHQAEYQEALDEIVRLDARLEEMENQRNSLKVQVAEYMEDNSELTHSVEHLLGRLKTSEEIRQQLANSLSGRCCGGQITMGNTDAKIVHGSVVVSDPDVRGVFLGICNSEKKDA